MKILPLAKEYYHKWNNLGPTSRHAVAAGIVLAATSAALFMKEDSVCNGKTTLERHADAEANYNKADVINQKADTLDLKDCFNSRP